MTIQPFLLLASLAFAPGAAASVSSPATALSSDALQSLAISDVAQRTGAQTGELAVENSARARFALTNRAAMVFKVLDQRTGTLHEVALDDAGQRINLEVLHADEEFAHEQLFGRLDPRLALALEQGGGRAVEVIVWLRDDAPVTAERPIPEEGNLFLDTEERRASFFENVDAVRRSHVATLVQPVRARLAARNQDTTEDLFAPVIYGRMSPAMIREVATWSEVDRVYLADVNEADMDIARATTNATIVNSLGITGFGVKVGQIEVGGRIQTANPYLAGVAQDTLFACASASGHSTGVAGIIRSTHGTHRGVAAAAQLYAAGSCSGSSSELQSRSTAAATWGARALNLSWGSNIGLTVGANDRFYDSMVINQYRTIVKSAGNENGPCNSGNGNVTSPGLAYNVIAVGNFNDNNTVAWAGDSMSNCSSWRDPSSTYGDREKPEVSAPGTSINSTTTSSPWVGGIGSGTSFAAPHVTGVAALLMQRSAGLTAWPEAVKAILMASAVHNIEGATRLSEYDGAGGIDAYRADRIASGSLGSWGGISYTCSAAANTTLATVYLVAGKTTRVVMAWDADPNYSNYANRSGADLDLQIKNSAGAVVASSSSFDNTYEIVEFTPTVSGSYTINANKYSCAYSPRWLGWAWTRNP